MRRCDILDQLKAELELERELGIRIVEFDRTKLRRVNKSAPKPAVVAVPKPVSIVPKPAAAPTKPIAAPIKPAVAPTKVSAAPTKPVVVTSNARVYPYVYLHDRPLSERGKEMMTKIITALGHTDETTPIVVEPPLPQAEVYVVLGSAALKRFFPATKGGPSSITVKTNMDQELLITYSPEYLLRFTEVTAAVKAMKASMWLALKALNRRGRG